MLYLCSVFNPFFCFSGDLTNNVDVSHSYLGFNVGTLLLLLLFMVVVLVVIVMVVVVVAAAAAAEARAAVAVAVVVIVIVVFAGCPATKRKTV